ncbi:MAG: mannose-6-phosphate isomerase [Verrucomicrobia bacterium]|nr:mannose-6-phosphate isomerase [Verrucomicrobiota bacterium]
MLYPLTFQPIFKERVWGGRRLQDLYGKALPPGARIGESWEISDRPGDESVVTNGPLAGRTLRWLMEHHGSELLGAAAPAGGRFPLLVKLLDARDALSLQVHPPAAKAAALGGEPKTELWYFTEATADACIHAGLRSGVTRAEFERRVRDGTVAECFHRIPVRRGDAMFLPGGRVHALGAGCVLIEVQQNSDTTYRVFDWNRPGLDGKPRELHVGQALEAIDFGDFEPALVTGRPGGSPERLRRCLVNDNLFSVAHEQLTEQSHLTMNHPAPTIIACLDGRLQIAGGGFEVRREAGEFCLIPADTTVALSTTAQAAWLRATAGKCC